MSIILGINAYHAGAAAAIVVDGVPIAAIAEERLNRVKHFGGFPALAINACLQMAGLSFHDIDFVSIGRDPLANRSQKVGYALRNLSRLPTLMKIKKTQSPLDKVKHLMADRCGADYSQLRFEIHFVEHHIAHIASAYFVAPWEHAAGLTVDGSGDFVSCMMTRCEGPEIRVLKRLFVPHSLGSLYTAVCQFIGYPEYGDEGKVMGLAPLGEDNFKSLLEKMAALTENGFKLNKKFFSTFGENQGMIINDDGTTHLSQHYSNKLTAELGSPRTPGSEITKRDQDLACSLQTHFELAYFHLANQLHCLVPSQRLAMAGGCALNSVANGKLFRKTPFSTTCIQPAAGDDGLALGSALYVSNSILREGNRWAMTDAYLGPSFSNQEIEKVLVQAGVNYTSLNRECLLDRTSQELAIGKVVGWFQGRMEWGPRALGNRSILAHPGRPDMKDILNSRIKHRESFRPFAPAVLADRQNEIFTENHPSPFMLHVYKIRETWRERLCAVNHVDNTGRLQTVSREENELYYDLIYRFGKLTGIPVLLNTSFNENEPVVCNPEEAVSCFLRTRMDFLVIGSFFCTRENMASR